MDVLTTDRLTLRPFRVDDGPALHAYLGDPQVVRFEPYDAPTPAQCELLARERSADDRFVAVCRDDVLVGNLYLAPTGQPRTFELGVVLHPAHGGRGYATEAARALLDRVFAAGAHRVVAGCDPRNAPSWRLLERLGMRREAHLLRAVTFRSGPDGRPLWHDAYRYAVLADEWRARADGEQTGPR
ncbi:GNAT family N-acetyltransferase [Cellulomonas phragmiteti]|uniref:N-acetyltransferase GCN5 n=1 Tax=Cellulomonas phragmiteti TaxID=478780 RepID=A0ABQ4DPP8_9CELL|nr:GNAT family N-acetyltransferase [Cellulomonas phragmiteti]GIG41309.1 N-acetyltransferase GCN5 [Cellulomonas phragmiteti]